MKQRLHKQLWDDRFPQRKNSPATWTALIWQVSGWVKHQFFFHIMSVDTNTFTYRRNAASDARYFAPAIKWKSSCVAKRTENCKQNVPSTSEWYEWFCSPKLPWFSVCLTTEFYRKRRTIPKMSTQTSHFSRKFYKRFGGLADLRTLKVNSCFHLSPHVRCAVLRKDGL